MGGYTDTNAAIAGALLGARFGLCTIPTRWLVALRRADEVRRGASALIAARVAAERAPAP